MTCKYKYYIENTVCTT